MIADGDLIADCNNVQELLNLCAERGIDTLIYMGVASNMCLCYRSLGMLNARRHGLRRSLRRRPGGSDHGQRRGSGDKGKPIRTSRRPRDRLWSERFLEQHVAPSIESRQLLAAAGAGRP